jgi:hypothetical protein
LQNVGDQVFLQQDLEGLILLPFFYRQHKGGEKADSLNGSNP